MRCFMSKAFFSNWMKAKAAVGVSAQELPGTRKKSFAMYYGGTEIWFEHVDGMYSYANEVMQKFIDDTPSIARPSAPSLIAVNLDETAVNEEIIALITDTYIKNAYYIQKVVFIGLDRLAQKHMKKAFAKRVNEFRFAVNYINDFEKAKEWLAGK